MEHQKIIFTNEVASAIDKIAVSWVGKVFVICDYNVEKKVLPLLYGKSATVDSAILIAVPPCDINKNLETLSMIWTALQNSGADRRSLVINIGGGMITDMGGFAAATFKRGVHFINVPTTLLSAVDAAVGGKTGINFNGFKNEIGVFREADAVIISTCFFETLSDEELKSGYAEMIKHGLLEGENDVNELIDYNISGRDMDSLLPLLEKSVDIKRRVVHQDPLETGLRKALNLGHTAGHAFESLAMKRERPIPHGYAVAWGCVVELVLSHLQEGFPASTLHRIADYVRATYGVPDIDCSDYDTLLEFMRHDKKNSNGRINFTLLAKPGDIHINRTPDDDEIKTSLDIFRDLSGI